MRVSSLFLGCFRFLTLPAVILTILLYVYPAVQQCRFPDAVTSSLINGTSEVTVQLAPFRLLTLADPQLEGDTSIPDTSGLDLFDADRWRSEGPGRFKTIVLKDIPRLLRICQKSLDLWGNDYYLAHVYRSMYWWTNPTHTVVLGDLLGSQWISDEEFERRTTRFWNGVFNRAERVPEDITETSGRVEILGQDPAWKRRIIALAGNHDIGYSGDINEQRLRRFEDAFGHVNWDVTFRLNDSDIVSSPFFSMPELRLVILNSMNLDTPALEHEYYQQSLDFISDHLYSEEKATSKSTGTILLTHIPFHKESGVCVDDPFFAYDHEGRIREQNHLSVEMSRYLLHGLARPEKPGTAIVLNGHDHEGCDTHHRYVIDKAMKEDGQENEQRVWQAERTTQEMSDANEAEIREITVRSMMGGFWGNAGLLSAWFDKEEGMWKFEYASCLLGIQHIWWAVHIFDVVVLASGIIGVMVWLFEKEPLRPSARALRPPPKGKSKEV